MRFRGLSKKPLDINEVRIVVHNLLRDCFFVESFSAGDFVSFLADFAGTLAHALSSKDILQPTSGIARGWSAPGGTFRGGSGKIEVIPKNLVRGKVLGFVIYCNTV